MVADYEKLKQEEAEKSAKLQEFMSVSIQNRKNQTRNHSLKQPPKSENFDFVYSNNVNENDENERMITNKVIATGLCNDNRGADKQNIEKIRKDFFNIAQSHCNKHNFEHILNDANCCSDDDDSDDDVSSTNKKLRNSKSLLSACLKTFPLQLHLLISLTMVLLTHRCPQYLIVL